MTEYSITQRKLILASFALGQAQRDLEEAQSVFDKALAEVEGLENLPTIQQVKGILSEEDGGIAT